MGGLWLLVMLLLATVGLSGCFVITDVSAPSGPPTSEYVVTLQLDVPDPELEPVSFSEESRGVLAVRFPEEWQLLSATYSGPVQNSLTHSPVITAYYQDLAQSLSEEDLPPIPGITLRAKPGYQWWAGYSAPHLDSTSGPLTVQLVFDQGSATGAYQLDFLTGVADALLPEDPDAFGSAWDLGGMALDQPVFTGVPFEEIAPQAFFPDERDYYVAEGETLASGGGVFDPQRLSSTAGVDFGDGQSEELTLAPLDFALGVWEWEWEHAWQAKGDYVVRVRAGEAGAQGEATALVHVGQSPFHDVPTSHRFFRAILDLWRTDVIDGYPDGSFGPENPVLRAQLAKMVVIAFGYHDSELTNPESPTFKDVLPGDDPYPYDYIEEAASNHLVTGFADDTFRPWDLLSRVQLVRVLVRSQAVFLRDPPADYHLPFTDVVLADRQYLATAHYNGLVQGKDATHFDPYGRATRGHLAQILYNALHVDLSSEPLAAFAQASAVAGDPAVGGEDRRTTLTTGARLLGLPDWALRR